MDSSLEDVITEAIGADGVSFIKDGQRPGISLRERTEALVTPQNVIGNLRYVMQLCGLRTNNGGGEMSQAQGQNGETENIIIPGYGSRNSSFASLAEGLAEDGIESHDLHAYRDFNFRTPLAAAEAATHLQSAIEESPAERINLICHSKGGIIALMACAQLVEENRDRIGHIITLGTPWNGTLLAWLLSLIKRGDKALAELVPHSDLLKREIRQIAQDVREKTISIGSVSDKIVPWESAILEGALLNAVLRRGRAVTHANFLQDKNVARAVAAILKTSGGPNSTLSKP